jgi:hypothetical protein
MITNTPALNVVHRPPGGQAVLYQTENRYLGLLEKRFGQRFLDYRLAWAEAANRTKVDSFPLSLDLAVNSGCNLACLMCPLPSNPADRQYAPMDTGLYRNLMDQAKENFLPALTLGLASEPLLNPDIALLVTMADRAGIMDIRLGTNAQALTVATTDALIDSGLTRLEISIDSATSATYREIRRGGGLAQVERAIGYFLERRAKKNQELPLLRLSFLELPQNQHELVPFLDRWRNLADLISIQKPVWFPGSQLAEPVTLGQDQLDEPYGAGFCLQPWQRLALDRQGRAWPCCSWYGRSLLHISAVQMSISDIWQSKPMETLRASHLADRLPPACQKCAQSGAF